MDILTIVLIGLIICALIGGVFLGYFFTNKRYQDNLASLEDIQEECDTWTNKLKTAQDELWSISQRIDSAKQEAKVSIANWKKAQEEAEMAIINYEKAQEEADDKTVRLQHAIASKKSEFDMLDNQTKDLQRMQNERAAIENAYATLPQKQQKIDDINNQLTTLRSELALYSELDEYVSYGIYPLPKYGDVNSMVYQERLKQNREQQKQLIKDGTAYTAPNDIEITGNTSHDKQLVKNQGRLLITAFNSECDYLISKVNSNNFETVMTKIEKLAEQLEKHLLSLEIGIDLSYVELKMQECTLFYQYTHQKEKEAEEQREIRAIMREEAQAQREIERAIREAEKEEQILQRALETARRELANATDAQKQQYEAKLQELTLQLAEAESRGQRAISMAQQTKQGHVYIISNIGSFGEDVYKIGMTRRLNPLDRIYELGDASVPFAFDIHAIIFSENAPALEKELHDYFANFSVNKVNYRKEFFYVNLTDVRTYLEQKGIQAQWTMAAEATEYRQSLAIAEEMIA